MLTAYALMYFLSAAECKEEEIKTTGVLNEDEKENKRHVRSINAVSNQGHCKNIEGTWTCDRENVKGNVLPIKFNFEHKDVDLD